MRRFKVWANDCDFGVIAANSDQDVRDIAAGMAGYVDERDMVQRLDQPSEIELQEVYEGEGTVRIYPEDSATLVEGKRIRRCPTREEVLAYFSHPPGDLIEFFYWSHDCANQRRQCQWKFTAAEVSQVHPMYRSMFIAH